MRLDRRIVSLLWLATAATITASQAASSALPEDLIEQDLLQDLLAPTPHRHLQEEDEDDSHDARGDWIRGPLIGGGGPWGAGGGMGQQDSVDPAPTLAPTETLGAHGGGPARPNCPTRGPVDSQGDGSPESPASPAPPSLAPTSSSALGPDGIPKTAAPVNFPDVDNPPPPTPTGPTTPAVTKAPTTTGQGGGATAVPTAVGQLPEGEEGDPTAAPNPDNTEEGGEDDPTDAVNEDAPSPTKEPTFLPTDEPSPPPTVTMLPSPQPSPAPTNVPSVSPTASPSAEPSLSQLPSATPSISPSSSPTVSPAPSTSAVPSGAPTTTASPTEAPTGWGDFAQDHTREEVIAHKCGMTSVARTEATIAAVKEISGETSLRSANSAAFRAYNWINRLDGAVVCPQDGNELVQRYTLAHFYYSLEGNSWRTCTAEDATSSCETEDQRWLSPAPECEWYGLTCSEEGVLTHLELPSHGLDGSLPTELFGLTHLQGLSLGHNQEIAGRIPPEIAQWKQLLYLDLDENKLEGPFPNVYDITTLQAIDINNNRLSGSIADEIAQLTNLVVLQIEHNAFTGALPVAALAALEQLVLFSSQGNAFASSNADFVSLETLCDSVPAIRASQTPAYLQFFLADCGGDAAEDATTCSCCSTCY